MLVFQLLPGEPRRSRTVAALLGTLLFVVYPLHAETTAWIVGRVDLFCTCFYLASLSLYIRFRRVGQHKLLALSLLSFSLALASKEMAVSLPLVIAGAEILLAGSSGWQKVSLKRRSLYCFSFAILLVAFAALRTALLGTLVGGYGAGGFREFLQSRERFFDVVSLKRILFGINSELKVSPAFELAAYLSWLVLLLLAFIKGPLQKRHARILLFAAAWTVVSVLPAFQVWQISSNLVGSRLFFLGSAGFCIFVAVALMPLVTPQQFDDKPRQSTRRAVSILGSAAVLALVSSWTFALQCNLSPWIEVGKQMNVLTSRLIELVKNPQIESVVLFGLPQDFEGASMVGNEDILHRMLTRPVSDDDYSKKISLYKDSSGLTADRVDPVALRRAYESRKSTRWLCWSKVEKRWLDWTPPGGANSFSSKDFAMVTKNGLVDCKTIDNPRKGRVIWAKLTEPVDPFAVDIIEFRTEISDKDIEFDKKVRLIWRSASQPRNKIDYSDRVAGKLLLENDKHGRASDSISRIAFQPGNLRDWLLNGKIAEIGFVLPPGSYSLKLVEVKSADRKVMPESAI